MALIVLVLCTSAYAATSSASVTELWNSPSTVSGWAIDLWAKVKNTGDTNLGSTCQVRFYLQGPAYDNYLYTTRPCNANDHLKSNPKTGDMVPGEERWFKITYATAGYSGKVKWWAIVEENGKPISRWSSEKQFTLEAQRPAAEVTRLDEIGSVQKGKTVELWAEVKNTGNIPLTTCVVDFYVEGPGVNGVVGSRLCTANDYTQSNPKTGTLAVGEKRWYKVYYLVANSGDYKYWAIVRNGGKDISRWSYGQSFKATAPETFAAKPEASVTIVKKTGSGVAGQAVELWAKVKNTGKTDLTSSCIVVFYVRGPNVDSIVGSRPCNLNDWTQSNPKTGNMAPGEERWYKVNYWPQKAGDYELWAIVKNNGKDISRWSKSTKFTMSASTAAALADKYTLDIVKTVINP